MVKMGDMVGEEFLFELKRQKRHENAYAEDDCYLLEISRESFKRIKDVLFMFSLKKDWLLLEKLA